MAAGPSHAPPSWFRRAGLGGGILPALLLMVLPAWGPPGLHTELRESIPAADAVLEEPVEEVVLIFTTPVQAPLSQILVYDADGGEVATGPVEHPPAGEDHLRVALESATTPGEYRVEWRTVAPDGHVAQGSYAFQVAADPQVPDPTLEPPEEVTPAPDPAVTPPAEADPDPAARPIRELVDPAPGGTGTRWVHLLGITLLLGVLGFRFGVLAIFDRDTALPETRARILTGLARFAGVATLALLITLPLQLWNQLADVGLGTGVDTVSFLLLQTPWGAGWLLHLLVVTLGVIGLVLTAPKGRGRSGWRVLILAGLLIPLVPALQGHAWGVEASRPLAVASLYLHVVGVGLWLGGLILLLLVGVPALKSTPPLHDESEGRTLPAVARLVNGFSRIALLAVFLVILTGVLNAWLIAGGPRELIGTTYGRTLLLKLGALGGAFALGFYNWRVVRPSLADRPDPKALRIPASVEAALGIVVLLITAVLVATPPST